MTECANNQIICSMENNLYLQYEKESKSQYNRRTIDGHIVGCGKCVGYCQYYEHPGFLTADIRKKHNCIDKKCHYYLAKPKKEKDFKINPTKSNNLLDAVCSTVAEYDGMRIVKETKSSSNERLFYYVTITNSYYIPQIESILSERCNEKVRLIKLDYDYEVSAKLIYAE